MIGDGWSVVHEPKSVGRRGEVFLPDGHQGVCRSSELAFLQGGEPSLDYEIVFDIPQGTFDTPQCP